MPKFSVGVCVSTGYRIGNHSGDMLEATESARRMLVGETEKYITDNVEDFLRVDIVLGSKILRGEVYLLTRKELQEYIDQALYGRDDG